MKYHYWEDVWTVFWRDWVVLKRRMTKFILSRMVAPMLYLVAFGWGLGRSIQVDSGTYLDFIVPGILALNSMNISFNSITPVHAERIYHKSLEEYIIAPIWPDAFVIGKVAAAVLRALISSAIIVILALLFGAHFTMTPLFFCVLVLNCIIFAEIGFLAAMKINTYEEMAQVNTYILLPMSFLCGTFFSTQALPSLVRLVIEVLPLTHTSYLLRGLGSGAEVSYLSLLVLLIYAFIGLVWGSRSFRKLTE
ncbi:ABC transporter permease [Mitsuokella sp. AF21-1AC]|uniref:ABC transporter permease n=1 Tax=Mitsuokella sp. AF21-1AC TaxID=2292235 RepID=UPI000E534C0C|nr:ABC transporter permease [Mitsuokella sp. AF21-1AC]RGS74762.1 multidrug ABC transporter permease [Mitsuokella sp. AF21-1AC]